ncbi:hypothetical protein HMPREF1546_01608 [Oscillibacter sp. KLE 1745]|nr:hypothetical protein HMPREF1546_01608 [Oscillibacter sp. KLE 1745]
MRKKARAACAGSKMAQRQQPDKIRRFSGHFMLPKSVKALAAGGALC